MTVRITSRHGLRWAQLAASCLAAFLTLASVPAQTAPHQGKWEGLYMAELGLYYIDARSIRREGAHTEVWTMLDYKKPQSTADGKAFLSTQSLLMLNCSMKMGRIMHMTYYSGAMAAGNEVLKQGMLHDWMEIDPGSPVQRIAKRVC